MTASEIRLNGKHHAGTSELETDQVFEDFLLRASHTNELRQLVNPTAP